MKLLTKLLLVTTVLTTTLMSTDEIIVLDTKGHTDHIRDIVVTKDHNFITASDDKTIRIWDRKGKEKRRILGQIGTGNQGKIYAIALSPDQKYLAVGGYFAGDQRSDKTAIRIYHYRSGKLLKLLKSHTNVVNDLSFSLDSKYLISGSSDHTAKIWSVQDDFSLTETIKTHQHKIYAAKIIIKSGKYYALTAGDDNYIRLYDIEQKREIKKVKKDYNINYLALSHKEIAASGNGKEITIYDYSLSLLKIIPSRTKPKGLGFSPDGRFLIAGCSADPQGRSVHIYATTDNYTAYTIFRRHKGPVSVVAFLDNHTVITAGDDNHKIYIWDAKTGDISRSVVGKGGSIWGVGVIEDKIAWGTKDDGTDENLSSLQKMIDLDDFKISDSPTDDFKRISKRNGNYTLSSESGGAYGYGDAVLVLKKNTQNIIKITRESYSGSSHLSYGFYKDYIVSGGEDGYLEIYDLTGKKLASLIGHTGDLLSLAIDGDRLVSGSSDQTMKVWDLSLLTKNSDDIAIEPILNIFVSNYDKWVIWSKSGYYASSVDGDKFIGYHVNQGQEKEAQFLSSANLYEKRYKPSIIQNIIKYGSEKKAIAKLQESKNIKILDTDIRDIISNEIILESSPQLRTTNETIKVIFTIRGDNNLSNLLLMKNGRPLTDNKFVSMGDDKYSVSVKLSDGLNIIMAMIKSDHSTSAPIIIEAMKESIDDIFKPVLYMLSIGVSDYQKDEYNLTYASKDATDIVELFGKQKNVIFRNIKVKKLVDHNATKDNILGAFDWLDREVTQRDVVIIFIAGHGVNKSSDNYYFLSHEADMASIRRSAVNWRDFKDIANRLPSKVILLVDTCHSGNINGGKRDLVGAVKSITSSGTGEIIMTATTANGYSLEDDLWQNGAFTKAFLDGVGNMEADYNQDKSISIKEIDLYITLRVKELTQGQQKPTTIMPNSIPDFAIWHKPPER